MSLCVWEPVDWLDFRVIAADPEVMRYIHDGTPWTAERARRFVERQIALFGERGFCLWKLAPKDGGPLLGFCGLQPLPDSPEIEIGWWLAPAWWGRGLATEAARVALCDGFGRAGLERIVAIAQPAHAASIRIMQKLGMRYEGMAESRGIPVVRYALDRPPPILPAGTAD